MEVQYKEKGRYKVIHIPTGAIICARGIEELEGMTADA